MHSSPFSTHEEKIMGLLSQFFDKPLIPHYNVALHVLRYANASLALGLFSPNNTDYKLSAFADAD